MILSRLKTLISPITYFSYHTKNLKYKSSWSDSDSSWNDLETFFNNSMESGLIGDLPISNDCNRSHVCRLWSFDGKPKSVLIWQVKVAFIDVCNAM